MRSVIFAVSTALTVLLSACTGAASSVPVNTVCRKHGMPTTVCANAYAAAGWTDEQIDTVLQMQTPDNAFLMRRGFTSTMLPQMLSLMMPIF